ncbi:DNA modification methylase [Leptolyngbya sp. PCC 7375]|nr:DNA modification methylase [Leptolyngbya sp. PCC 7375]
MINQIIQGDCLNILPQLPEKHFNCCATSPPYFGLRDYDVNGSDWPEMSYQPMPGLPEMVVPSWHGCLGQEATPEMFTAHLVHVFRAVWRVLRDDGCLWLNLGDSYASKWAVSRRNAVGNDSLEDGSRDQRPDRLTNGLKEKDLIGIPWRVAMALQADGWYLRQDVIWQKVNPLPESVKDRCTKAHEYLFLFSKQPRYAFDHEAIKEPAIAGYQGSSFIRGKTLEAQQRQSAVGSKLRRETSTRNKRSVWPVASEPCKEAHYAVMPSALIEPCILAGSPPEGHVLDPFGGAGTTGMTCKRHRRNYTLIELSPENCAISGRRIDQEPWPQLSLLEVAA